MTAQWWSWVLTAVGLTCFWLAGRKVWWAWFVGLAGQLLWLAYALVSGQLGFLVGVVAYSVVYARNAARWTRERPYFCPTGDEWEDPMRGGFDTCCDAPELHTRRASCILCGCGQRGESRPCRPHELGWPSGKHVWGWTA